MMGPFYGIRATNADGVLLIGGFRAVREPRHGHGTG
jgi:hypothetical protein